MIKMQDKLELMDLVEFIDPYLDKKYGLCAVMSEPWKCGEFELVKLISTGDDPLSIKALPGGFRTDYLNLKVR